MGHVQGYVQFRHRRNCARARGGFSRLPLRARGILTEAALNGATPCHWHAALPLRYTESRNFLVPGFPVSSVFFMKLFERVTLPPPEA